MTKYNIILSDEEVQDRIREFQLWTQKNPQMPRHLGNFFKTLFCQILKFGELRKLL